MTFLMFLRLITWEWFELGITILLRTLGELSIDLEEISILFWPFFGSLLMDNADGSWKLIGVSFE